MKAIRIAETGGPEVMKLVDVEVGKPGPGQVRVRQTAIGLNYIDTYHRSGLYPLQLPSGLGLEAAGVVEEVGEGVTSLKPGDRIAYGTGPIGAYAGVRNLPANRLVKLPPCDLGRNRGRHDAEGHDGALPAARHLCGEAGRHHPAACRGRRRGPDHEPVGQGAGRHRHRHGGL